MINPLLQNKITADRTHSLLNWCYDPALCPTLPVVEQLRRDFGSVDSSVAGFFGLQHLLGSTASLIDSVVRGRMTPSSVFLLGKPYSANREVVDFLTSCRGYYVHPQSLEQPIGRPNDDQMDARIKAVLDDCRRWWHKRSDQSKQANNDERILLIDDGGRAIRLLHTPEFEDICEHFTCVEQTRAGIRAIEDVELRIPVVNVAESWVKLEHESPMIAESVNCELSKQLIAMEKACIPTGHTALIIGYGAIGQAVGKELRKQGRAVFIYEPDVVRRELALRDGFPCHDSLHAALAQGGLIVGCTGKPVLDYADYRHIPHGAILVSASSADIEFRGWQLRPNALPLGKPELWQNSSRNIYDRTLIELEAHPCFCLYMVRSGSKHFYLVNGGFPVNFTGEVDPITPDKIQLTRGLLYCGAVQASSTRAAGLMKLSDGMQHRLINIYKRSYDMQRGSALC
jgi:hypothetical protein